jgi:hypothetical protein
MRKKSFLIAVCIFAAFAVYGQNPNMVRVWSLDSVKVNEISVDNKEIQIDSDEVKDSINKYVFDKIDIGFEAQYKIIRGKEELSVSCDVTDNLFTIKYKDENISYKYTFDGNIYFKREFSGINSKGKKVNYVLQMRFMPAK